MNLFKRLCNMNQEMKYNFLWEKLTEFTNKQVKERRAAQATAIAAQVRAAQASQASASQTDEGDPVGLCDLPDIDPPGTKRKKGNRFHLRRFEAKDQRNGLKPSKKTQVTSKLHLFSLKTIVESRTM